MKSERAYRKHGQIQQMYRFQLTSRNFRISIQRAGQNGKKTDNISYKINHNLLYLFILTKTETIAITQSNILQNRLIL